MTANTKQEAVLLKFMIGFKALSEIVHEPTSDRSYSDLIWLFI